MDIKKTWLYLTLVFHVVGFIVAFIMLDKEIRPQ